MKENEALLFALAGIAVGAVAVYIYISQSSLNKITEITRDASGRVIGIIERRM